MTLLGVWCFVVCFGNDDFADKPPQVLDTYCQSYHRVVKDSKELEHLTKLPQALRDRIQKNELEFLCRCQGWGSDPVKNKVCTSTGR